MSARVRFTREERLEQIIREATAIIGRSGYHGFSVQELADQCGITVGGLLHHVGTKENLLIKVLQKRDADDIAAVSGLAGGPVLGERPGTLEGAVSGLAGDPVFGERPGTLEGAVSALDRIVERNSSQPAMVRLYAILRQESLDEDHPAHEYFAERDRTVLESFFELFSDYVEDPRSFARQLLAVMGGLEEQWLRTPGSMDLLEEWQKARTALLRSSLLNPSDLLPMRSGIQS